MGDLADTDVLPLVRRFLSAQPGVNEALGGEGRVGVPNEPPYPIVRLSDPPGNDRTLTHLLAPMVQIEVLGDPGVEGQNPDLKRALYRVLQALKTLPEQQALRTFPRAEGEPWVTEVTSSGGGGSVAEPTGQERYIATVTLHVHP